MADAATGKVPIVSVARDAWGFLPRNVGAFLAAAAIVATLSQIGIVAESVAGAAQSDASGALDLAAEIPAIVAGLMFTTAILRKAVRDVYIRPVGLTLGKEEVNLLGAGASMVLLAIPMLLIISLVVSAPMVGRIAGESAEAAEALASDPSAMANLIVETYGTVGTVLLAVGLVVLYSLFLGLLAFVSAATIGEGRIVIFGALAWLRGNILHACAAIVLTAAPAILLSGVASYAVMWSIASSAGGAVVGLVPFIIASAIGAFIGCLAGIPISALGAVLYKGLRPETLKSVFS